MVGPERSRAKSCTTSKRNRDWPGPIGSATFRGLGATLGLDRPLVLDVANSPWLVLASAAVVLMAGLTGLYLTHGASPRPVPGQEVVLAMSVVTRWLRPTPAPVSKPCETGVRSSCPTSPRVNPCRTASSRASTRGSGTNYSTARSSTPSARPESSSSSGVSTTTPSVRTVPPAIARHPRKHHPDGLETHYALILKSDHSVGACQVWAYVEGIFFTVIYLFTLPSKFHIHTHLTLGGLLCDVGHWVKNSLEMAGILTAAY